MKYKQQYYHDDDTVETNDESDALDHRQHVFFIKSRKRPRRQSGNDRIVEGSFESLSNQYRIVGEAVDRSWFERKIVKNPRVNRTERSPVSELCGISNLQLYYRNGERGISESPKSANTSLPLRKTLSKSHQSPEISRKNQQHLGDLSETQSTQKRRPINKLATLLTFDPDTGFYDSLIRGNACIVLEGNADIKKTFDPSFQLEFLEEVLALIFERKEEYHKWGADFSEDARKELLNACDLLHEKYFGNDPNFQHHRTKSEVEAHLTTETKLRSAASSPLEESKNEVLKSKSSTSLPKGHRSIPSPADSAWSDIILESFQLEADDILASFDDEIHTLFPTVDIRRNNLPEALHDTTTTFDSAFLSELTCDNDAAMDVGKNANTVEDTNEMTAIEQVSTWQTVDLSSKEMLPSLSPLLISTPDCSPYAEEELWKENKAPVAIPPPMPMPGIIVRRLSSF